MNTNRTLIIVPTYNERENVPLLIKQILATVPTADILLIDDSSPDGTADFAEQLFGDNPNFSVLRRTEPRGLGRSYLDGYQKALAAGYARVVQMDADLSHDPKYLPDLIRAAESADVVIGSRYCAGGGIRNWPLHRRSLSRFANMYVRAIVGFSVLDSTSGFRCYSRRALESIQLNQIVSHGYAFLVEMTHRAHEAGLRIVETPIIFVDRRRGKSKISRTVILESIIMPWRMRLTRGTQAWPQPAYQAIDQETTTIKSRERQRFLLRLTPVGDLERLPEGRVKGIPRVKATWLLPGQSSKRMVATTIAAKDVRSLRAYCFLFVVVSALLCLPLWSTHYVPLVDYPNHLARAYIIHHYNDVEAHKAMYDRVVEPLPNMAIDLVVPPLLFFFDANVAGKIFLTLTILLFSIGCHLLGKAIHGQPTWLALPCALLIYNSMFFWGFVNYKFSLGIFLISSALWIRYRKRWNLKNVAAVSLLALAGYFAHLSSYIFLGLVLLIITFFDYISEKRLTKNMIVGWLPLLPPLVFFGTYVKGNGEVGKIFWPAISTKLLTSVTWLFSYNYLLDCIVALMALVILLILTSSAKNFQVRGAILVAGCCFGVLFLICPSEGVFGTAHADERFLPPAAILTLVALRFEVTKRVGRYAVCLFLAILLIRLGGIWYDWSELDRRIASQVQVFKHFECEAKIYPVIFYPRELREYKKESMIERALWNTIHYSTISRHTFSPTFFSIKGQQPVVFKNNAEWFFSDFYSPPNKVNWQPIVDNHSYLWLYQNNDDYVRYLKDRHKLVVESDSGMIFRINR